MWLTLMTSKCFKVDNDICPCVLPVQQQNTACYNFQLSWAMRIPCRPRASMCNYRERDGFGTAACNSSKWDEVWSGIEEPGFVIAGGYETCITKGDGE